MPPDLSANGDYPASPGQHHSSLADLADVASQQQEMETTVSFAPGPVPPMPPNHSSDEDRLASTGRQHSSLAILAELLSQKQEIDASATALDATGLVRSLKVRLHHDNYTRMLDDPGYERHCAEHMQIVISMISKDCSVLIEHAFSQWYRLRAIYKQHMKTMKDRWKKWTKQKRKDILVEAWGKEGPGISPDRSWNVDVYKVGLKGNQHKWTYLLPWINLEDLSGKINLPLLIESRANHEPSAFAWSDMNTSWDVCRTQLGVPDELGHYMLLTDEPRKTYGRIMLWTDYSNSPLDRGHPSLSRGYICLDIQGRILTFLVRVCEHLVEKDKLSNIMVAAMESRSEALFPPGPAAMQPSLNSVHPQSLMEAHSKARYQVPQELDLNYLRRIAIARRDQAYDEIWALREDPSFFQETIADTCEFHQKYDNDTLNIFEAGKKLSISKKAASFRDACRNIIGASYNIALSWNGILEDLDWLRKLQHKYASELSTTKPIPREYNNDVCVLVHSSNQLMQIALARLALMVASDSKTRQYFKLKIGDEKRGNGPRGIRAEPMILSNMRIPQIVFLLGNLMNLEMRNTFGASEFIDDIERIMQDDSRGPESDLIDGPIANLLSEIATFAEIEYNFRQHQPKIWQTQVDKELDACYKKLAERTGIQNMVMEILEKEQLLTYRCEPLSVFDYPIDESHSPQRTRQIQTAETKLAAVWRYIDQHFFHHTGREINEFMPASMLKSKYLGESETRRGPFALPPRVYKVMAALFPAANQDQDAVYAEEIRWDEFVYALEKLGFSSQRIAGSLVYFEPTWDAEKPIMIYRPRPGDEIPVEKLRDHGRRLGWRYGWKRESFRERK